MAKPITPQIVWQPQAGPQEALVHCPLPEVFYGGARGGGKTDGIIGKWAIKAQRKGPLMNAVFFRKEMPQQDDLIKRSKEIYAPLGAAWHEQKKSWSFPNGAQVRFRPLENLADAEKYQGQNLSDAAVEEAGNYVDSQPIDRLFGCLRGDEDVQLIVTANPGGVGHHWIKARYIDPAPGGMQILTRELPNGSQHRYVYIPSRVENNRIMLAKDPGYVNRLYLVGSAALVQAWLAGDWNVIEGAFFDCWRTDRHVVRPFAIPKHWTRLRSGDWGSAKPFSFGWWAVVSDAHQTESGLWLPRGCMVRFREWYGMKPGEPNTGLKLTAEAVAKGIRELEHLGRDARGQEIYESISHSVLDPSAFAQNGGPSIAERMANPPHRVQFTPADNKRVADVGHMGGWDQMRARMVGDEDGNPAIVCFSTCTDSIRTIPVLQHDKTRPEDVDTDSEDHAGDDWRYACMARPWVTKAPEQQRIKTLKDLTMTDLWRETDRARTERL